MYPGEYTLIGNELSFFTRKLEAQLRFQQVPWHYQFKTEARREALEAKAGTHFIPLLSTPDRWLLQDTISLFSASASRPSYRTHPFSKRSALS